MNKPNLSKLIISTTFVLALSLSRLVFAHDPAEHGKSCGAKCIKNGGPVGIVENGKAYLVVGEHKPMNDQLAEYCGKTVTLKGKLADRGGIAMLENAEIVK